MPAKRPRSASPIDDAVEMQTEPASELQPARKRQHRNDPTMDTRGQKRQREEDGPRKRAQVDQIVSEAEIAVDNTPPIPVASNTAEGILAEPVLKDSLMSSEQVRAGVLNTALTPAQDREFKKKAIQVATAGKPFDPYLQAWLDRYMPPPPISRPPGYVAGGAVRERVRLRAEARHARVKHLMDLRARCRKGVIIFSTPPAAAMPRVNYRAQLERALENRARKERVEMLMKMRRAGLKRQADVIRRRAEARR
ncbi:hypothetical protein C8R43DRAFT_1135347 [Mycena crocata]|nr:hypothetical protein C8R43DRAFT_1135347 [Mycena crocata]